MSAVTIASKNRDQILRCASLTAATALGFNLAGMTFWRFFRPMLTPRNRKKQRCVYSDCVRRASWLDTTTRAGRKLFACRSLSVLLCSKKE